MYQLKIRYSNINLPLTQLNEIEAHFHQTFDRFVNFIREAQLTLYDVNGPKGGVDKLCKLQVRFYPRGLAVAQSTGITFYQAASLACQKMQEITTRRHDRRRKRPRGRQEMLAISEEAHGN